MDKHASPWWRRKLATREQPPAEQTAVVPAELMLRMTRLNEMTVEAMNEQTGLRKREQSFMRMRFLMLYFPLLLVGAIYTAMIMRGFLTGTSQHVAVVRLDGEIMAGLPFSAERVNQLLPDVMGNSNVNGLILSINSPGGSPAQSSMIRDEIDRLQQEHPEKKIVVVAEDLLASGAYLVASGADAICVQGSTVTGSIGVVLSNLGFSEVMRQYGVEPRLITAGEHKARGNPFQKLTAEDRGKFQGMLDELHRQFIEYVVTGRGERIDPANGELFSGDFWPGAQAVTLGLADGLCTVNQALAVYFDGAQFKHYNLQPRMSDLLGGGLLTRFGAVLAPPLPGSMPGPMFLMDGYELR